MIFEGRLEFFQKFIQFGSRTLPLLLFCVLKSNPAVLFRINVKTMSASDERLVKHDKRHD